MFSFLNKDNLVPFKASVVTYKEYYAIYDSSLLGPAFGRYGNELDIVLIPGDLGECIANFGYAFEAPKSYSAGTKQTKALLGGSEKFKPSEIETYYLLDDDTAR